jgi:hypothetical protein
VGFKRVAGFGEKQAADMLPVAPAGKATKAQQLFMELGTTDDISNPTALPSVVGILGRADKTQQAGSGGYHGSTADRGTLRKQLKADLRNIRTAAKSIVKAGGNSGIMGGFELPLQKTDRLLATKVRAFAEAAEPLRAQFVELEFDADFIETLLADVQAFENARDDQNTGLQAQAGADASIDEQITRGLAIVAQLDVIMQNKYKARPPMLAVWRSASRIERPIRGRAKPLGSTVPVVVPAPQTVLALTSTPILLPGVAADVSPVVPTEKAAETASVAVVPKPKKVLRTGALD